MVKRIAKFSAVKDNKNKEVVISVSANFISRRKPLHGAERFAYTISDADFKKLKSIGWDGEKPVVWVSGLNTTKKVSAQKDESGNIFFTNVTDENSDSVKKAFYAKEEVNDKLNHYVAAVTAIKDRTDIPDVIKEKLLKKLDDDFSI